MRMPSAEYFSGYLGLSACSQESDLARDGKRFITFFMPEAPAGEKGSVHVTMLLNFFDELRRRIPARRPARCPQMSGIPDLAGSWITLLWVRLSSEILELPRR